MAGEVLNMSNLTINKYRCKLKDLCFKTATKPYTHRCTLFGCLENRRNFCKVHDFKDETCGR